MSNEQGEFVDLGKLIDLMPGARFDGTISLVTRRDRGEITEAEEKDTSAYLSKCYVPTTRGKGIRCVEDRNEIDFDDSEPKSYQLGPQVQGATPDIAASLRLADTIHEDDSLINDLDLAIDASGTDYVPSAHTDVAHLAAGEMGCGALKGQEAKLHYYTDPHQMQAIRGVLEAIYKQVGGSLPVDALSHLPDNAARLSAIAEDYYKDKATVTDHLAQEFQTPESKKVVTGEHTAIGVAINFIPNTTLNTGKLNEHTNSKLKYFGLDAWFILQQYGDKAPYILADALATLMNLTDGTIDVRIRVPSSDLGSGNDEIRAAATAAA